MIEVIIDEFEDIELNSSESSINFYNIDTNMCSICLNKLHNFVIFDCDHSFHLNCTLLNMLDGIQRDKCPLCRQKIKITNNIDNINNYTVIKFKKFIETYYDLENKNNQMELIYNNQFDIVTSIYRNNIRSVVCLLLLFFILFIAITSINKK